MQPALLAGAAAFLQKPASAEALAEVFGQIESFINRDVRRLLVVDDDEAQRQSIIELVGGGGDVEIVAVGSSEEALAALDSEKPFDCMVLDLKLPKMTGFALLEKVKTDERSHSLPVIVYTGKELTRREETKLKRYAETIVVKDARSPERLLDETSLFLHRVESKLPESKRKMLEQLHNSGRALRRQEGADRRRRRPQRLRAHERARGERDGRAVRGERSRRDRGSPSRPATSTSS